MEYLVRIVMKGLFSVLVAHFLIVSHSLKTRFMLTQEPEIINVD